MKSKTVPLYWSTRVSRVDVKMMLEKWKSKHPTTPVRLTPMEYPLNIQNILEDVSKPRGYITDISMDDGTCTLQFDEKFSNYITDQICVLPIILGTTKGFSEKEILWFQAINEEEIISEHVWRK